MKTAKVFSLLAISIFILIVTRFVSCTHKADIEGLPEICFERDILPVFRNNCAISGCHDGTGESELILDNYASISSGVIPGKPYSSRLFSAIITRWGENKMPPDKPLSLDNRINIRLWIEQGAMPTVCPDSSGGNGGSSYVTKMPPAGYFSSCKIRQFEIWVNNGFLNN